MRRRKTLWAAAANAFRHKPLEGMEGSCDTALFWLTAGTDAAARRKAASRAAAVFPPETHGPPVVLVAVLPREMLAVDPDLMPV